MQEFRFFVRMCVTLGILGLSIGTDNISIINATTSSQSTPEEEAAEYSSSVNDSALASLSQALEEDKEDGHQNGGESWDKKINNLEDEMGFPVDEDVEGALMNITEVHLNNMSIR